MARLPRRSILRNQVPSAPSMAVGWHGRKSQLELHLPSLPLRSSSFLWGSAAALCCVASFSPEGLSEQGRSSLLLSCAFMATGAETGSCGPPPPKQSRISTTQTNSSIWNTASQPCPQGGPCVWIRLSCVTPFLSHNWKEFLLEEGMVYPPCWRHTSVIPVRTAFCLLTANSMFPLSLMKSVLNTDKHDG